MLRPLLGRSCSGRAERGRLPAQTRGDLMLPDYTYPRRWEAPNSGLPACLPGRRPEGVLGGRPWENLGSGVTNRRLVRAPARGTAQAEDKRRAGGTRLGGGGGREAAAPPEGWGAAGAVDPIKTAQASRLAVGCHRNLMSARSWRGAVRRVRSATSGGIAVVRRHDAGLESHSRRA
jgi:hypothetical protein